MCGNFLFCSFYLEILLFVGSEYNLPFIWFLIFFLALSSELKINFKKSEWVQRLRWRKKWKPTPVFLPGESHAQKGLVGYNPWGCKGSDTMEVT